MRFCNSGTEANLFALSLARVATGKPAIMVFEGSYHGGVFFFGTADGSPINAPFPFVVAPYNDEETAARLIAEHAHELAAVLVEPLQGWAGAIPGEHAFLQALREATAAHGVLLVFDEVMTSRLSTGGLQSVLGITPDLTTLGKYLGGGLAFGAFGGRADLMSRFDPSRPDALPHAGTFNNAVLTMAAGAAGLTRVYTEAEVQRLNGLGDRLRDRLNAFAARDGAPVPRHGLRLARRPPLRPRPGAADLRPAGRRRSCARCCTCTCSSAATRTRAAASSRSRCRSTKPTSTGSPRPSRSSSTRTPRSCATPSP